MAAVVGCFLAAARLKRRAGRWHFRRQGPSVAAMGSGSGSLVTLDSGAGYHSIMRALAIVLVWTAVGEETRAVVCKRRSAGPCRACRAVDWLGIAPPTVQVPGRWQLNGRRWLGTETKSTRLAEHMQCSCVGKRNTQYSPDIESSRPHSSTGTEPGCCTQQSVPCSPSTARSCPHTETPAYSVSEQVRTLDVIALPALGNCSLPAAAITADFAFTASHLHQNSLLSPRLFVHLHKHPHNAIVVSTV